MGTLAPTAGSATKVTEARRRTHALPCLCLKFWTGHRRDLLVCRVSLRMAEGEVARSTSPEAMVFVCTSTCVVAHGLVWSLLRCSMYPIWIAAQNLIDPT